MPISPSATSQFIQLIDVYKKTKIEFPHLKRVTVAQWALETGWGTSKLALRHLNFGGAKWRDYMKPWATKVPYEAHDGLENYCAFPTYRAWIEGYWGRLDVEPAYKGWRDNVTDGADFIQYIGPIWVGVGVVAYLSLIRDIDKRLVDVIGDQNDTDGEPRAGYDGPRPWDRVQPD